MKFNFIPATGFNTILHSDEWVDILCDLLLTDWLAE